MTIEHCMDGADGRQGDTQTLALELFSDLRSSPGGMFVTKLHDARLEQLRQSIGLPIRPSRAVGEALKASLLVAGEDLVAGLARDIELSTKIAHPLAFEQASHKSQPFVHFGTLLPRHLLSP